MKILYIYIYINTRSVDNTNNDFNLNVYDSDTEIFITIKMYTIPKKLPRTTKRIRGVLPSISLRNWATYPGPLDPSS